MVRIIKVKELEDRKRVLVAQSEIYRQTLKLEVINVKYSAALLKRKFNLFGAVSLAVGAVAPLAGFLFAQKRSKIESEGGGLLSKLRSGIKFWGLLRPFIKHFQSASHRSSEENGSPQVP